MRICDQTGLHQTIQPDCWPLSFALRIGTVFSLYVRLAHFLYRLDDGGRTRRLSSEHLRFRGHFVSMTSRPEDRDEVARSMGRRRGGVHEDAMSAGAARGGIRASTIGTRRFARNLANDYHRRSVPENRLTDNTSAAFGG